MELHDLKNEKGFSSQPTLEQITDNIIGKYLTFTQKFRICQTHFETIDEAEHDNISFSHGVDRESEGGSSFLAYFNIVCVVAGTGALGLPYALKQGGWIGNNQQSYVQHHDINSFFIRYIGLFILGLSWLFSTCKYIEALS
jgi:hypothetical protein